MDNRKRLRLIGITYNQIESGVYALILEEENGSRRIPIIIGYPEAQAIECKLQEVMTPRPLTHDLMVSVMTTFDISLREVIIYRLPNGVFAADLIMTDGSQTQVVDARSSDAVALAIRVGAPVYTTEALLNEIGFEATEAQNNSSQAENQKSQSATGFRSIPTDELLKKMDQAAEDENYEEAARIKQELDRRKSEQKDSAAPE